MLDIQDNRGTYPENFVLYWRGVFTTEGTETTEEKCGEDFEFMDFSCFSWLQLFNARRKKRGGGDELNWMLWVKTFHAKTRKREENIAMHSCLPINVRLHVD